jgi:hypothetical protein
MARFDNDWMSERGAALGFGTGAVMIVAGTVLAGLGRPESALIWTGAILIALGAAAGIVEIFRGHQGRRRMKTRDVVTKAQQAAVDVVVEAARMRWKDQRRAGATVAPAEAAQHDHDPRAGEQLAGSATAAAASPYAVSPEAVTLAARAAGSNSTQEFRTYLMELNTILAEPVHVLYDGTTGESSPAEVDGSGKAPPSHKVKRSGRG